MCCLIYSLTLQEPVLAEREHLQVYLRIRPLTATESEFGESQVWTTDETECFHVFRLINQMDKCNVIEVFQPSSHFTGLHFSRAPRHCGFKGP